MRDITPLDAELNQMILSGQILEAFEKFYADDVEMQENAGETCRGKDANRKREQEFLNSVQEFHGATLVSTGYGDNVSFGEWIYDVTYKEGGRKKLVQVTVRRWRGGEVIHERFYYDTAA